MFIYDVQNALHLATIKNNLSVVEYLVKECKMSCSLKDNSGLSAVNLAVSKGNADAEWVIRKSTSWSIFQVMAGMGLGRFIQPK
jgi:hypothetical protein